MQVFENVALEWNGETFTIPSNRVMGAISRIERTVTLTEIYRMQEARQALPLADIAMAYAAVLAYAGCKVTDAEVYKAMFDRSGDVQAAITGAVQGLLALMIPPDDALTPQDKSSGKDRPAAANSSPQPTERRSAPSE